MSPATASLPIGQDCTDFALPLAIPPRPTGAPDPCPTDRGYVGQIPSAPVGHPGPTIADIVQGLLATKAAEVELGDLSPRTLNDLEKIGDRLLSWGRSRPAGGMTTADFADLKKHLTFRNDGQRYAPKTRAKYLRLAGQFFRAAVEDGLIDPPRFGQAWKPPGKKAARQYRQQRQKADTFEPIEVRNLLARAGAAAASPYAGQQIAGLNFLACCLLGINCGFGNRDCGLARWHYFDLARGWHQMPRPKTGEPRSCWLWPETVAALTAIREHQLAAGRYHDRGHLFLGATGQPYADQRRKTSDGAITRQFSRHRTKLATAGKPLRFGLSFYSFRHTFATVASQTADRETVRAIIGHTDDSVTAGYVHGEYPPAKILAAAGAVHHWLYGGTHAR